MEKVNHIIGRANSLKCSLSLPLLLLCCSTGRSLPEFFTSHNISKNLKRTNSSFYANNKDKGLQEPKNPVSRANPQILFEEEFEEVIAKEPQLWAIAQKANTLKGYKEYLAVYPADIHSQVAQNMIRQISARDEVASTTLSDELKIARYDQNRLRAYQKYLNNQPAAWFLLRRDEAVHQIKTITTRIGTFNIIAEPVGGKSGEVRLEIMHGSARSPQEFDLEIRAQRSSAFEPLGVRSADAVALHLRSGAPCHSTQSRAGDARPREAHPDRRGGRLPWIQLPLRSA